MEALALLAAMTRSDAEAIRLLGAAHAGREVLGLRRWPIDQPAYDEALTELRCRLGDEAFDAARNEGMALSLEEAAGYASRARGQRRRPPRGWDALTPTERQVVALAAEGLTNAEIGRRLFISPGTVRIHLSHIYAKVDVANRTQLAARATARAIR
jgi:DNA-binding CsgD family transcriptional regulator